MALFYWWSKSYPQPVYHEMADQWRVLLVFGDDAFPEMEPVTMVGVWPGEALPVTGPDECAAKEMFGSIAQQAQMRISAILN